MPKYPAQIDTSQSLPTAVDNLTPVQGSVFNRLRDAVLAIETELGVKPSGVYSTVKARLDALEGVVGNLQIIELDEDLGGTLESPLVIGLQGRPISSVAPAFGQVLGWNGIAWGPSDVAGGQGTFFQDLIIPPLTVNLMGTKIVEVGQTVTTPAFTATYFFYPSILIPPQGASFKDGDNNVPLNVAATPNSFSSPFTFVKNTFGATVVFTLSATIDLVTKNGELDLVWGQLLHWGVGPAAQSGASFINSLSGSALTTTKDFAFSVTAGATEKIYFACRSAYGNVVFTVHDVEGGFTKTGTFLVTNAHGFAENYDLYESDNVNLGNLIIITGEGDDEFIGGGGPVGPIGPQGPPGASGTGAVIFDGGITSKNARTDRPLNQSPIDNTKDGIINLSSNTTGLALGATGNYATIVGGDQNAATADYTFIGGGLINSVDSTWAAIIAGENNTISGGDAERSIIGGGQNNTITNTSSAIVSGENNNISRTRSFIGSGDTNIINAGSNSAIVGGTSNTTGATNSIIGGGQGNTITSGSDWGFIGGGQGNNITDSHSAIGGGHNNTVSVGPGFIGGGFGNVIGGDSCFIGGGETNQCNGTDSVIAGGAGNITFGTRSFVGGGSSNQTILDIHSLAPDNSTIAGGNNNQIDAVGAYIGGGDSNYAGSIYGVISGGKSNNLGGAGVSFAAHSYCTIGGGFNNLIDDRLDAATIPGGQDAHARISGQLAYASGSFAANGDAQTSIYLVKGTDSTGGGVTLLGLGAASLPLVNGFAYTIRATLTANRTDGQGRATFIHTMLVHATGGTATIDSTNTTLSIPNGQAWTISYSTTGLSVLANFTGTVGQTVRALVKYEIIEVGGGP